MKILVADDEPRLLAAYRACLAQERAEDRALTALGRALFPDAHDQQPAPQPSAHIDYVTQGEAAVEAVARAVTADAPYGVLFLDMRMPPGIDGLETARRIRALDRNINIVVVTGHADYDPQQMARVAGPLDKLYHLSKPFQTVDIQQLACALTAKWALEEDLKRAHAALEQTHIELGASEAHCRHMALHDQLTQLPNRLAFQEYLSESLTRRDRPVGAMFVDLDHFKRVNDTIGHQGGDMLICAIGSRIAALLPGQSILARLGGDEFGIIVRDRDEAELEAIGQSIVAACGERLEVLGHHLFVGASVGLALRPAGSNDGTELLRRADLALYAAKSAGRGACRTFQPEMEERSRTRAAIDLRLRHALDNGGLTLAYQPIVRPADGMPIGYEALLRWDDAVLGPVAPGLFVPVAEESGLVTRLGEWVLHHAIAECARWDSGFVSVNLSTRHFQSGLLLDYICRKTKAAGLSPGRLQIEITEAAIFEDPAGAADILRALRAHGIRVALDDFGTGYSSLVNLRDFALDCIKIDKSFIATLGKDRQASAIINAVTSLARSLGLNVVAEGVETEVQLQSLKVLGCEMMQGFFYSRPMQPDLLPFVPGRACAGTGLRSDAA